MPNEPGKRHHRRFPLESLAGGLNDSVNPALLASSESPDAENVDFDRESVQAHGGAVKFNNQVAPHAGILTRVGYAPLAIESGKSVPQRGYVNLGYDRATDPGGDFVFDAGGAGPSDDTYHARRGRSIDIEVAFELPIEEKLYVSRTGAGATLPLSDLGGADSYDEGLEEATLIWQKGGDRLSPLSCGLAIVNTGGKYETLTGDAASDRVSNYALVFLWLDAPQWGHTAPGQMRYRLGAGGANVGTGGAYCTLAYRAVIAKAFIEPGRRYSVAVSLRLDSGDPGTGADPTAAWNQDGELEIVVRDQRGTVTRCATDGTDLFVWKGPSDSIGYLKRYGVRFSGRDALYLGLGYRFAPWSGWGFAPYGLDSASMEAGGFRMLDVSAQAKPAAYTVAHTCTHASPNTYVTINVQGMHGGVAADLPNPLDPTEGGTAPWGGLYDSSSALVPFQITAGQSEAFRNYWLVLWGGTGDGNLNGLRVRISHYLEVGASYRFECGLTSVKNWAAVDFFIIPFRWHQRPLRISSFRIYDTSSRARVWTSARTQFSLSSYPQLDDATEPDLEQLVACWPLDDAGGGLVRELVAGRHGHLAPYGLGRSEDGGLFLSGEGEALCLDFEDDPVLRRELAALLRSATQGFAIELKLRLPQAFYARAKLTTAGTENRTQFAPVFAEWACKDDSPGYDQTPAPLLRFGHYGLIPQPYGIGPFYYPRGFDVQAAVGNDQAASSLTALLNSWSSGTASNWSDSAEWVGQTIRLQVGIQSTGTDDQYTVYIAASPKSALLPANGDPPEAEFAYFATQTIHRRDLVRSVITIGGAWRPESDWGYMETSCPMIVEEARIFGAAAPGALPTLSGGIVTGRDGKLNGDKCLPARELALEDLVHRLGTSAPGVTATEGSTSLTPADGSRFFTAEPESTLDALKETYLAVAGDDLELWEEGTVPTVLREFYWVSAIGTGGSSATLSRNYNDRSGSNLRAVSFRVIGYSSFNDDLSQKALAIGQGTPFAPPADPSDAVLTEPYFENLAPVNVDWRLRVFASQSAVRDILPQWDRGVAVPRKNPILGLESHQGKLYGVARGSLFEFDDRWRKDGPTEDIEESLAFRASSALAEHGVLAPLQDDGVLFDSASGGFVTTIGLAYHFDGWVKLDSHGELQTIAWCGDLATNSALSAGSTTGTHRVHWWMRLARGYPEFALGSTATYDGVNRPEKGLFVMRAATKIPVGVWTHVRWVLPAATGGTWVATPKCYVNGRPARTTALATQNGAAGTQWVQVSTITGGGLAGTRLLLGVARDSYLAPELDVTYVANVLDGELFRPNRHQGYLHSLDGRLAQFAIHLRSEQAFFDPYEIAFGTLTFRTLHAPEGVGHKLDDTESSQYGVIESHPAISLFHEMGLNQKPASWARYGERLFVTTGGRPVYAQD